MLGGRGIDKDFRTAALAFDHVPGDALIPCSVPITIHCPEYLLEQLPHRAIAFVRESLEFADEERGLPVRSDIQKVCFESLVAFIIERNMDAIATLAR
jgi:hypothetical protein